MWSQSYFSPTSVISSATGETKFKITETKLYVPVVTLSTQDNAKLLQQLKSGLRRTIKWSKYQSDPKTYAQNRYLNDLLNLSFLGVNRPFALSFENGDDRTSHSHFQQPINSELETYKNIRKVAAGKRDDYRTGCSLDYSYFEKNYKMIAIIVSKQQALDTDPRVI